MEDAGELAAAFKDVEGVFILPPSDFDPLPGYPEARRVIDAIVSALSKVRPRKVICLSTIGADAPHDNLLTQRTMLEEALRNIGLPVTFLRAAWFTDNAAWDVASARDEGVLHSFLQPADKAFPMVASGDVGRLAADLIRQGWNGTRVVELEGPARVTPTALADAFATALGRRSRWKPSPATAGRTSSGHKAWRILCRRCGCSTASTKAGSNSMRPGRRDGRNHACQGHRIACRSGRGEPGSVMMRPNRMPVPPPHEFRIAASFGAAMR
jgi:uncharacterized protein YbjT (DUF2867 family)